MSKTAEERSQSSKGACGMKGAAAEMPGKP